VTPNPDALERIRARLDGAPLAATEATVHWEAMISPDGTRLSAHDAAIVRMIRADAELGMLIEFAREPRAMIEIPDLRPIPFWAWALGLGAAVALMMGQGFMGLLLMILWIKF